MFFVVGVTREWLGSSGGVVVVTQTENTAGGIGYVSDDTCEGFGNAHNGRPQWCVWSELRLWIWTNDVVDLA